MYSYDRRTKTATQIDFYQKWRSIMQKHKDAEQHDFDALLHESVNYFKSCGFDLDPKKSYLGKEEHGSDGMRIVGEFHITEDPRNNFPLEKPDKVAFWVEKATGMHCSIRKGTGPGSWVADFADS